MKYRGVILDDYPNVARQLADWSQISEVDFKVFNKPLGNSQQVIGALKGAAVVCLMRERTLISRDVIEAFVTTRVAAEVIA